MNPIEKLFRNKNKNILSVYFTAGYPYLDSADVIISELEKNGADLIEVGLPFSDPLVDGPTIQKSNSIALRNGINADILFAQLSKIKTNVPLILMGYLNQMMKYGEEKFLQKCKESGISGLIIPDIPVEEYVDKYKELFDKYDLRFYFLITPKTSDKKIRKIDSLTEGFIYVVSSSTITGAKGEISTEQKEYFERIQNMNLKNPTLVGFGISNAETYNIVCRYNAGAIIGSAFINALSQEGDIKENIKSFVEEIKRGEV